MRNSVICALLLLSSSLLVGCTAEESDEELIVGCMDSDALNFNANATVHYAEICLFEQIGDVLLECNSEMWGGSVHDHVDLRIVINGSPALIPENIGVNDDKCEGYRGIHTLDSNGGSGDSCCYARLHIHTALRTYPTIGDFFVIWGQQFDEHNILNETANDENEVVMSVNGQLNLDYEDYLLQDGDRIEIQYRERQ